MVIQYELFTIIRHVVMGQETSTIHSTSETIKYSSINIPVKNVSVTHENGYLCCVKFLTN